MTDESRRPRRLVLLLAVATFLTIAPSPATAQPVDAYLSIVDQYAAGDENGALNRSLANVPRIPPEITSGRRTLTDRQLRSAIMLHTELTAVFLIRVQSSQALSQIGNAQRLLRMLTDDTRHRTASRAFALRWYAFATNMYAAQGLFDQAFQLARSGLSVYPNAVELFVARGAVFEMRASVADPRRVFTVIDDYRMSKAVRNNFDAAAAAYAQALAIDPHHAFAHLHRGWVHHRVGDERAVEELQAAVRDATDDGVRYLAHLFLGAEAERHENLEEARRQFEAAHQLGPFQTSAVALGRVESALGHSDRARSITVEYALAPHQVEDPWWNYMLGGFEPGAINWLRAEARRP